ncbi:hypothetical protein EC55P1_00006 [Enterococcus phage EC55P1]|nr:hypothetical protein EC55P1_00006 [Enterococcus phage EC55P1]
MGTFLLVVLIIILMLLAAFVGVVVGMFSLTLLTAKALAAAAAGKDPMNKMKELSETFHRLVEQQLSKEYGITGAKVSSYLDVEFPDAEV